MLKEIIFYLFIFISLIHITHIGLYIVGGNYYDIWQYVRRGRLARKRAFGGPLVSVVIPAHNEETGIARTISSVYASSYKNIEIIVVDDGSTDATAQVARGYIRSHFGGIRVSTYLARGGRGMQLRRRYIRSDYIGRVHMKVVFQENEGKAEAVNNGIKNYAQGSLIMTLDADSLLSRDAIANAVNYFEDPKIVGVAANVQVIDQNTVLSVLQKIEHLIGYRSKKFYTAANCEFVVGGVASTYRAQTIKEVGYYDNDTATEDIGLSLKIVAQKGNKDARIVYASNVVAYTQGVQSYKALFRQRYRWKLGMLQNLYKNKQLIASSPKKYGFMMTKYRIPMAFLSEAIMLIEPLLLLYILYLSVMSTSFGALFGAYLVVTLYILWNLLPDENLRNHEKLRYGLISPFMYFIFYVMNAVQVVAVVRCLKNYRLVAGRVRGSGIWDSPERAKVLASNVA